MYFGVSQYPETEGMSYKEVKMCIAFCAKKEGIKTNVRFFIALAVTLSLAYAVDGYIISSLVSVVGEYAKAIPSVLVFLFFGGFLLYEINVTVKRAVVKHIEEFKHNQQLHRTP